MAHDDNELSVPNLDRLIIERDDYKDRWETLGRVAKRMIEQRDEQLREAVDLVREARFYVDARATGSVKAAKLLDRIDTALGGQSGR